MILAEEPRRGLAKTRLACGIGETAAARLADAFLLDTCALAEALPHRDPWVAYPPP